MKPIFYKAFVLMVLCLSYSMGVSSRLQDKEKSEYYLVWEDHFNDSQLNEYNWQIEVNADGGGNSEMQYYRAENISLDTEPVTGKCCLIITAKKEEFGDRFYTSGRINTQGKVSFKYGKIEASIKLPKTANGLWPAFWLLGDNNPVVGWPQSGEIDIMESGHADGISSNTQEYYFNGACHWGPDVNGGAYPNYANHLTNSYPLQDDFHLYTLIWDEESVRMYLDLDRNPDATPYYEMKIDSFDDLSSPGYYFHSPYNILFNMAVGGRFTGITGNCNADKITALNEENNFTAHMYVDFVRLYQKGDQGEEYAGPEMRIEDDIDYLGARDFIKK